MGAGASKKALPRPGEKRNGSQKNVVTADVVIPGKTTPIRVRGEIKDGNHDVTSPPMGPTTIKEVAPNKFSLQQGDRSIGTFDVPNGDFGKYLMKTAELTVTNIESVGEDAADGDDERKAEQTLQIQLARQNSEAVKVVSYSDDEDWDTAADDLDRPESKTPSAMSDPEETERRRDAKERKAKIKNALRQKRAKLSQQEYQQMINSHKQEMELMNILRERQKNQQRDKLGSKVAERKKRRAERMAEDKEKAALKEQKEHKSIKKNPETVAKDIQDTKNEIESKTSQFQKEVEQKRARLSGQEYNRLLKQHEEELAALNQKLNRQLGRQKVSFLQKLAARKNIRRGKELTAVEIQQLEAELKECQQQFEKELREKKSDMTDEEYKRLIATHQEELRKMQEDLETQRQRQRQTLLDKLAARKGRRTKYGALSEESSEEDQSLSPDEIKELQMALNQKVLSFKQELKSAKSKLPPAECQKLIDQHREEMERMQEQLDDEKERMRQILMEKLEARRRKGEKGGKTFDLDDEPMTPEDLKQLQLILDLKDATFKRTLAGRKKRLSNAEYRQLLDDHEREMEALQKRLGHEKEMSHLKLKSKLEARRFKRPQSVRSVGAVKEALVITQDDIGDNPELQAVLQEIQTKETEFKENVESRKDQMSNDEYLRLLAKHNQEMERLNNRMNVSMQKQNQNFKDKLDERRRRRKMLLKDENLDENLELNSVVQEIDKKEADFEMNVESRKGQMSDEEYKRLLAQHEEEMERLNGKMKSSLRRQNMNFKDKLEERRRRRAMLLKEENIEQNPNLNNIIKEIESKETDFEKNVESKKNRMTDEEYRRLLAQHEKEMERLNSKMNLNLHRQNQNLQDKLEERRRRRAAHLAEEEERNRLLALLDNSDGNLNEEDVSQLEGDMADYDKICNENVEKRRGQMSDAEVKKMIAGHKENMRDLEAKLERQRRRVMEKLDAKRASRRARLENEADLVKVMALLDASQREDKDPLSEEEIETLEQDMQKYDDTITRNLMDKRGVFPDSDIQMMMADHRGNMDQLSDKLLKQKQRMQAKLQQRREEARHAKLIREDGGFEEMRGTFGVIQEEGGMAGPGSKTTHKEVQEELGPGGRKIRTEITEESTGDGWKIRRVVKEEITPDGRVVSREESEERTYEKVEYREVTETAETAKFAFVHHVESASDSEDEDDFFEVDGLQDASLLAQQAMTTEIWTTPVHSSDILIMPLAEEYPVKKKRELYTDPAIFRELDAHAIRLAQTASLISQPTFSSLVDELASIANTELETARVVFRWITAQNCEEMNLNEVVDDTPLGVLKGLYQKKITFSTLFMRMCRFVGLKCVEITGSAKLKGFMPGQELDPNNPSYHHTWNAVRIDGFWHFLDCNWGVSHIPGSVTFDPFRFEYDEHYFLADPEVLIMSHFPNEPAWQLLEKRYTLQDFNSAVLLKPDFFKHGFGLLSHNHVILCANAGEIDLRIICPPGFLLSCRLSEAHTGREKTSSGILYDLYEFIHQVSENVMACYVRIPEPGDFHLTIFAKLQFWEGELNIESPTEICRYFIRCSSPSSDKVPLPLSPADHWGPIGVLNGGLVPVSHRSSVIASQDGRDFEIIFKKLQNLRFTHELTAWNCGPDQLQQYAIHRCVADELIFTVTPPRPDRYGLHIFVQYYGATRPVHLCSYLLVASVARTFIHPYPTLREIEEWGPNAAFRNLGLSTFTNPDPLIRTGAANLQIVVSYTGVCFIKTRLYHSGKEISHMVQVQEGPQYYTFDIHLTAPGYYVFKLFGKEISDPDVPFSHAYNYLISKE